MVAATKRGPLINYMNIRFRLCNPPSMPTPLDILSSHSPFASRRRPSRNSVLEGSDSQSILLFVTVCANGRQRIFAHPAAMNCLLAAWDNAQDWRIARYMVMPDHVHLLCFPGNPSIPDFHRWLKYWKAKVALSFPLPHVRPLWQRQCWDTQIRQGGHFSEKWEYIRANPV
jgi:putative transposase